MSKLLISLALLAAQALPYAGGPWFTCVSRDGSVCVDRGPQACCCLADEIQRHAACGDDHNAAGKSDAHSRAAGPAESQCSPTPCDCKHELLSHEPTTVTRGAAFTVDLHVQIWAVASFDQAISPLLAAVLGSTHTGWNADSLLSQRFQHCVVLRC